MTRAAPGHRRFKIGLSFPGEIRDFVKQVADHLKETHGTTGILYDDYHEEEFGQPCLDDKLCDLYKNECEIVAVFLCERYWLKDWCKLEWSAVQRIIQEFREPQRVMLLLYGEDPEQIDVAPLDLSCNRDGFYKIEDKSAKQVSQDILSRLQRYLASLPPLSSRLPEPLGYPPSDILSEKIHAMRQSHQDIGESLLERHLRVAWQQTFPTNPPLDQLLPELGPAITWDSLDAYFRDRQRVSHLSETKILALLSAFDSVLKSRQTPAPSKPAVLSILVRSSIQDPGSYEGLAVLEVERFHHLGQPKPFRWPTAMQSHPGASGSAGKMIGEFYEEACKILCELDNNGEGIIIDLYLPVQLLDEDWGGVALDEDQTRLGEKSFRLRSSQRWQGTDFQLTRAHLLKKYNHHNNSSNSIAWFVLAGGARPNYLAEIAKSHIHDDHVAIIHADSPGQTPEHRFAFIKRALSSWSPLVIWPQRECSDPADFRRHLEEQVFPYQVNRPATGVNGSFRNCDRDLSQLAIQGCHDAQVLFEAPLDYVDSRRLPRLFIAAEGGDVRSP